VRLRPSRTWPVPRPRRVLFLLVALVALGAVGRMAAQSDARPGYDVAFIGPPLADPVMQHNKETYVLYGCAYCHGVNLVPRGEAADLRQSAIVAADVNADQIGAILRAGIPQTAKLSPMPQFSDLSDAEIRAIAAWIHYARARARYDELVQGDGAAGSAAAGAATFAERCASCHATDRDLAGIGGKYDVAGLRAAILEPQAFAAPPSFTLERLDDTRLNTARATHQSLLENYTADTVADLVTYLQTAR
jgi:mono/diheme cytochrome c family protein